MSGNKPRPDPLFPHGAPPRFLIDAGAYPDFDPLWPPGEGWRVQDGLILLPPLVSDGTTGMEWIIRLVEKGFNLSVRARQILRSPDFRPTAGVAYRIVIFPSSLFPDYGRTTVEIRANAARRGLSVPPAEVVCLVREYLSRADFEAIDVPWIVVMHEPIEDFDGVPRLLSAGRYLEAYSDRPMSTWSRAAGFAFLAAQAGP